MEYLKQNYNVLPVSTALEWADKGIQSKKPIALVTFDDGYKNNFLWAYPVMKDLGLPFTIFVVTDHIDSQKLFWFDEIIMLIQAERRSYFDLRSWGLGVFAFPVSDQEMRWSSIQDLLEKLKTVDSGMRREIIAEVSGHDTINKEISKEFLVLGSHDLRELVSSGLVEVGSHTDGHEILTVLDAKRVHATISRSIDILESLIGLKMRYFSYPNGDFNDSTKDIVAKCGLQAAFITGGRHWTINNDVYAIPRIGIGAYDTFEIFVAKTSGLFMFLSNMKKALVTTR